MDEQIRNQKKWDGKKIAVAALVLIILLVILLLCLQKCGKSPQPGPVNVSSTTSSGVETSTPTGSKTESGQASSAPSSSSRPDVSSASASSEAASSAGESNSAQERPVYNPSGNGNSDGSPSSQISSSGDETAESSAAPSESSQVTPPEIKEYKQLPSSVQVSKNAGAKGSLPILISRFPQDGVYRSIEGVIQLPQGIQVTGVSSNSGIQGGKFDWNVGEDGVLRFAYLAPDARPMQFNQASGEKVLVTVSFQVSQSQSQGASRLNTQWITAKTSDQVLSYQVEGNLATIYFQ